MTTTRHPDPAADALDRAYRVLRQASVIITAVAREEGWAAPRSTLAYLILAHLGQATSFGFSPGRLAHLLRVPASTLAHHLRALEEAGAIRRAARDYQDGRKTSVRLTEDGRYARARVAAALARAMDGDVGGVPG